MTTRFGAAAQPEPEMPRPHALPVTRKTLSRAARTPGLASNAGSGGATFARGPRIVRNGSTRAIASRRRDGGTRSLISPRIRDLHLLSQLALPGRCERDGCPHADDRRRRRRRRARAPPSGSSHRSGGSTNRLVRIALLADRRDALKRTTHAPPPAERHQRCVRRLAAREELRRELGAEIRTRRRSRRARAARR